MNDDTKEMLYKVGGMGDPTGRYPQGEDMTYKEFIDFVKSKCTYETIYKDGEGRLILVIDLLSAYVMVNKAKHEWVGLTEAERIDILDAEITTQSTEHFALAQAIEAKLKEKNT
jgi:hypothetical protein